MPYQVNPADARTCVLPCGDYGTYRRCPEPLCVCHADYGGLLCDVALFNTSEDSDNDTTIVPQTQTFDDGSSDFREDVIISLLGILGVSILGICVLVSLSGHCMGDRPFKTWLFDWLHDVQTCFPWRRNRARTNKVRVEVRDAFIEEPRFTIEDSDNEAEEEQFHPDTIQLDETDMDDTPAEVKTNLEEKQALTAIRSVSHTEADSVPA